MGEPALKYLCLRSVSLIFSCQRKWDLEVVMVVIQHFHFTDEKIRHWSKSPRVTVAQLCLPFRSPDLSDRHFLSH